MLAKKAVSDTSCDRCAHEITAAPIVVSAHRLDQHVEAFGVGVRDLCFSAVMKSD
jgi:hypothetical protein